MAPLPRTPRPAAELAPSRRALVVGAAAPVALLVIEFGSDSFMIVRSVWPYWRCSGPVVYGMSYLSHSARTLTAMSG